MKLTFWGAAGTVTGSMHLVESSERYYLLDCGMYQGRRKEAERRNRSFPFDPRTIDAVILSHAHIDHSGNLPTLLKGGFSGPIYANPATIDLCDSMLRDTGHIQESDAAFVNRRRNHRHEDEPLVEPLYTVEDAVNTMPLFRPVSYRSPMPIHPGLTMETYDAGHMLGSACVVLNQTGDGGPVRLSYSGDIGRPKLPIVRDPDPLPPADYLIMESTYGGRFHKDLGRVIDKLEAVIRGTAARGGKIIVPAFAVGRTQQLVLLLHELTNAGRIPDIPIFVDSPLAINVTQAFREHPECFDEETREYIQNGEDPFGFKRLQYVREASESKKLNDLHGPFVVIAASGMCEAGRILHHLRNNIEDPRNTILITGYQAQDTLGRKLVEKWPEVRIFGEPMRVRAEVKSLDELSGHADHGELLAWLRPFASSLKRIFLVHGEPGGQEMLAKAIRSEYGVETVVPSPGQSFVL
jgi:metallo-beta-lactamase family protein